ncbi:MAG: hypothetical protein QKV96_gp31 [Methanophagales virus GBV303]|uniref:Uncharacterized protein n=1 Tax=Methanophagales virus GBV303 TaxID=2986514 RepID=A0A9E8VFK5_9VIRU|nr:MAG: hypothetical protein QKV96_gp31 [Methanophagales virus GBV303]WAE39667.1 MAG: hypothetical protein NNKAGPMP_00031 [Methanophagales virus GBV303]
MRLKKEKREEMKQKIIEFLKNADGHIATIPMLARAIQASSPTAKSIVWELEVERKVSVVMLGGEYVVKLEERVIKDDY